MQGLQDPHAKVRWAACQAVGQMCTDLGPDIQNDEHAVIVPALTEVMKDFNEPRVQAHAAAAIVNFSENCDEEILTGYLDNLITQLLGLLQNGQKLVKVGSELTSSYRRCQCPVSVFCMAIWLHKIVMSRWWSSM